MNNQTVMILTGPGGSGKSTIAELLLNRYNFSLIDGDRLDTEFFPDGGQRKLENINQLRLAHKKILEATRKEFEKGRDVVVDYIIFGDYQNFLDMFRDEFGDRLTVKVLWPSEEVNIIRDKNRQCWTTGVDRIRAVRGELWSFRDYIGEDNYINTSELDPIEVARLLHVSFTNKKPQ